MALNSSIKAIWVASYFSEPSDTELAAAAASIDNDLTTTTLFAKQSLTSFDALAYSKLAALHLTLFNTSLSYKEMLFMGGLIDKGISFNLIKDYFLNSEQFKTTVSAAGDSPSLLKQMVSAATNITLTDNEASYYGTLLDNKTLSMSQAIDTILGLFDREKVSLSLINQTLQELTTSPLSTPTESTFDGKLRELINEHERLSNLDTLYGTTEIDVIQALANGSNIEGLAGNDIISCSASKDTIIFESTADNNGEDLIQNFSLGTGGDVLDFTKFLNATTKSSVGTAISKTSTAEKTWTNGEVLTTYGAELTSSTSIANLFGTNLAFAAPTEAAKAVVLSADITGDTLIWYVVNQGDLTTITNEEIKLVGTLIGVNNIQLVPFTADNFN